MLNSETTLSYVFWTAILVSGYPISANADQADSVPDSVIAEQRAALETATTGRGFGPQSPRDIDKLEGNNQRAFGSAPSPARMNLCNIHLHHSAEHKGRNFSTYVGNGNGNGVGTGYQYNGLLTDSELAPLNSKIGEGKHDVLAPGDTVEIHFVYSSAQVRPGPTLGSCVSSSIKNPQLRVEAVIAVLVNDSSATDFERLATVEKAGLLYQATNLPSDLGSPIVYSGSTTGPKYNTKASQYQVTWSVRPNVIKINASSLVNWFADNIFDEKAGQTVRNLVVNPDLLSPISN